MGERKIFDVAGFYAALDSHRQAKGLNWKEVAAETKVSASTLTRMSQGKRPDVDSLASLVAWSGVSADDFMREDELEPMFGAPEPLAQITTILRRDKNLSKTSAVTLETMIKTAYEQLKKPS